MKSLYFHPERPKLSHIPVFTDSYYHESITYFLRVAESLEPQLVNDLDLIVPIYTKAEKVHDEKQQGKSTRDFIDDWNIIEQANGQNNPHLVELRSSIIEWCKKYNLVDDLIDNKTFLEIALWAIPDKRDYAQEIGDIKRFIKSIGKPVPQHFPEWSITDPIYFEDESETDGNIKDPARIFPFVYSPDYLDIHQTSIFGTELMANDYENVLVSYDMDVHFALKGEKDKVKGYIIGGGWDPRLETWKDFEEMLDAAYKKYKKLYKERTRLYMEKQGYVEGKTKRNKEHFEWMVRYQIQEWNIIDIADYYSNRDKIIAEDTVRKALNNVSDLLQLKLK